MAERRQAARRQPIEVQVEDERVFVARPLPWLAVNDLGNEIMHQNEKATNELLKMWMTEEGTPQLEVKFGQKIDDWQSVLRIAFPDVSDEEWSKPRVLDRDECWALMEASLEVNGLEKLKALVDPNSPTPMLDGGLSSTQTTEGNGPRIESTPDSDSQASPEKEPSTSPVPSS